MAKHSDTEAAQVRGRLWLERAGRSFLGSGRIELLEQIAEHGSISQAARAMKMSYKAAWDAVDAMNNLAEQPLVVRVTGGRHGGGTHLTQEGRRTIALFRQVEGEYRRFLARLSEGVGDFDNFYEMLRRFSLKTTVRNQFPGRVASITGGAVNTEVTVTLAGGDRLTGIVTNEGIESLGLAEGDEVYALFRESAVIVTDDASLRTSARNRLCGTVVRCQEGAVNGEVVIELPGGRRITAIITNESLHNLGLREGASACALIKASEVILATNG